jgi:hypothetical protein
MYISLKDSCTKGLENGLTSTSQRSTRIFVQDEVGREFDANLDLDNRVMSPADRAHRPWLVPGAGTL